MLRVAREIFCLSTVSLSIFFRLSRSNIDLCAIAQASAAQLIAAMDAERGVRRSLKVGRLRLVRDVVNYDIGAEGFEITTLETTQIGGEPERSLRATDAQGSSDQPQVISRHVEVLLRMTAA